MLRLRVQGDVVWSRELNGDGWFHAPVDLSTYKGQKIALVLECDTEGQWGCREVYLDYLTILQD